MFNLAPQLKFGMEELFAINLSLGEFILFMIAGVVTGIINTLAGSGSLITLPIFMFMCGLPAPVANGTNRIGVLMQSLVGGVSFYRKGHLPTKNILWLVIPMFIGAVSGANVAVYLDKDSMTTAIGILMLCMLVFLLINPKKWIQESGAGNGERNRKWYSILIFLGIGFYGGFLQAGVGLFLLAGLVLVARYSLLQGNAIKMLAVIVFSIPALIIFFQHNQVHIGYGLLMALFQSTGAVLGVRVISKVPNANLWIHRLLIVIVFFSMLKVFGVFDMLIALF